MREAALIDVILTRRSVREGYDSSPVDRAVLATVARCGLAAPSSKNAQPARLHVLDNRELLDAVADLVVHAEGIDSYVPHEARTGRPHPQYVSTVVESAEVLRQVPSAILLENRGVFSGGRATLADADPDALRSSLTGYGFELVGLGTALENMWLAALSLGLSAAFLGDIVIAEADIAALLGIEGDLVGALALGYAGPPAIPQPPHDAEGRLVWHGGSGSAQSETWG